MGCANSSQVETLAMPTRSNRDGMDVFSDTQFTTIADCSSTKAFLMSGVNWCKIIPTIPSGGVVKNESPMGFEIYENEMTPYTYFVCSEK